MPILITSPVQRCGTTLLQRLLSSSSDTLIYGETVANDLHTYASVYQHQRLMLDGPHHAWRDEQLQEVLAGRVNAWIPDLLPDRAAYLERKRRVLLNHVDFLADHAARNGRSRWGCKLPGWPVPQLSFLLELLPAARVVYIHRELDACVVSARAINLCLDEASTRQFRQYYARQLAEAERRLRQERVLWIAYEELVEKPAPVLAELAAFTGAERMDAEVMAHRIGNYGQQP